MGVAAPHRCYVSSMSVSLSTPTSDSSRKGEESARVASGIVVAAPFPQSRSGRRGLAGRRVEDEAGLGAVGEEAPLRVDELAL